MLCSKAKKLEAIEEENARLLSRCVNAEESARAASSEVQQLIKQQASDKESKAALRKVCARQ